VAVVLTVAVVVRLLDRLVHDSRLGGAGLQPHDRCPLAAREVDRAVATT